MGGMPAFGSTQGKGGVRDQAGGRLEAHVEETAGQPRARTRGGDRVDAELACEALGVDAVTFNQPQADQAERCEEGFRSQDSSFLVDRQDQGSWRP